MGIYKDVNPVYVKNDKGKRVYAGLKINGKFYEGIRKTSEIPTISKPKTIKKESPKKKLFGRD